MMNMYKWWIKKLIVNCIIEWKNEIVDDLVFPQDCYDFWIVDYSLDNLFPGESDDTQDAAIVNHSVKVDDFWGIESINLGEK